MAANITPEKPVGAKLFVQCVGSTYNDPTTMNKITIPTFAATIRLFTSLLLDVPLDSKNVINNTITIAGMLPYPPSAGKV